jgi:hypothetical protein
MNKDNINVPKVSLFKYTPSQNVKTFFIHPQYEKYLKTKQDQPLLQEQKSIEKKSDLPTSFLMGSEVVFYEDINNKKHENIAKTLFKRSREELEKQRLLELEKKKKEELEKQRLLELEKQRVLELEKKQKEELEKQRLLELEKKQKEELEKQRLLELEKKQKEELKKQRLLELERQSVLELENKSKEEIQTKKGEELGEENKNTNQNKENTPLTSNPLKVTIIVPMYNVEPYLSQCVTSLINQQYQNIEIFLINDCSRDNTGKIADTFSKKYPDKIKVIHNSRNVGTYISINIGIVKSTGDYITIIGADDVFTKNKVQEQVDILNKHDNVVACYCLYERRHYLSGKVLVKDTGESTIMFRKNIINKIGYYDSVRFAADSEYRDRIKKVFGKPAIHVIKKVLYIALFRPNSLTASGKSKKGSVLRKKYLKSFSMWHNMRSNLYITFPLKKRPFWVPRDLVH